MLDKIKKNPKIIVIFVEILLAYLGFWFLLNNLKTDGIWETLILNVLFFLIFPLLILKQEKNKGEKEEALENERKINFKICLQILIVWIVFLTLLLKLNFIASLKLNYLARTDWFLGDWWAILFLDLILVPVILFSQEFFFRSFLIKRLTLIFSNKIALVIQAALFVSFEVLFFEIFSWQFILFNFILSLFLGWIYNQTKSIWYSFVTRWVLILLLDGIILYKIQQLKI